MTKKIEAALTSVKSVRAELNGATRLYVRAAKNVATLEAKLIAAQVELDTAATKAEEALKKALATTKALTASSVKKVPAVKPAPRVSPKNEAKPLPKPGAVAPKLTRAQQREAARLTKAKAPVGGKTAAVKPAVKKPVAAKPAAKPAVKAPAAKPVRSPKKPGTVGKFDVKAK
ncbi:hypothetical protein D3C85_333700 [compost metagenome]